MIHNLTLWLALGLAFSLVSCVYTIVLREPQMLLNGWHNWLDKKLGPGSQKRIGFGTSQALGPARAMWLYKMLGGCPRCFAGQFAFWAFLALSSGVHLRAVILGRALTVDVSAGIKYAFFGHLVSTAASIFLVTFLQKAYNWSRKS